MIQSDDTQSTDEVSPPGSSHLDGVQGAGEERTETYSLYDEGAPEPATKQSVKNGSGVSSSAGEQATAMRADDNDNMEEAILYAKKYLEDLLSFFGLNTDVYATTEDEQVIELSVPSTHLNGFLIGQRGDTMRALQYTIGSALKNQNFSHTRVNVDIAGYKKDRAERLIKQAEEWFKEVRDSGQSKDLLPMNAAERRVVHKAAGEHGLETESVGEGRERHIILKPTADTSDTPPPEEE